MGVGGENANKYYYNYLQILKKVKVNMIYIRI